MKRFFLSVGIIVSSLIAKGQSPDLSQPQYMAQSSALLIRYYPGAKNGKVFLFGKKAADINLNQNARLISVTLLGSGKKEELKMSREGDGYLIQPVNAFPQKYELDLRAEVRGELQQMKIQVGKP